MAIPAICLEISLARLFSILSLFFTFTVSTNDSTECAINIYQYPLSLAYDIFLTLFKPSGAASSSASPSNLLKPLHLPLPVQCAAMIASIDLFQRCLTSGTKVYISYHGVQQISPKYGGLPPRRSSILWFLGSFLNSEWSHLGSYDLGFLMWLQSDVCCRFSHLEVFFIEREGQFRGDNKKPRGQSELFPGSRTEPSSRDSPHVPDWASECFEATTLVYLSSYPIWKRGALVVTLA